MRARLFKAELQHGGDPYIMCKYVENESQLVSIDMLIPCVHHRVIHPSIHRSGMLFDIDVGCLHSLGRPIISLLRTVENGEDSTRTHTKRQPSRKPQRRSKPTSTRSRWKKLWAVLNASSYPLRWSQTTTTTVLQMAAKDG